MKNPTELTETLEFLETLNIPAQIDFIRLTADETGGVFKMPVSNSTYDSQLVEIHVHGIWADGFTATEALRRWRDCAARHLKSLCLETQGTAAA